MPHQLPIFGVVEGFYGVFYTFPERNDLIAWMGRHGYNYYLYGPKNDRQHRTRWWEPYPAAVMACFAETIALARDAGVTFGYALAPISYSGPADLEPVQEKLLAFFKLGVRSFSILMDDITPPLAQVNDHAEPGYLPHALLHSKICNQLYTWLQRLDPTCTLSMCPTDYSGRAPFSNYLRTLGAQLHPAIDVFYSGSQVCPQTISVPELEALASVIQRKPLLWDNYPVNDLAMRAELHLGPIQGRDPALPGAVRGVLVNPMNQAEASKVALHSYAAYAADPWGYDPEPAWQAALRMVAGEDGYPALRLFAAHARRSCLEPEAEPPLTGLADAALAALQVSGDIDDPAVQTLQQHLDELDEACYSLKYRTSNLALRDNLLPWIEALENWIWLGKYALRALVKVARGEHTAEAARLLDEALAQVAGNTKLVTGEALMPLAAYARAVLE